MGRRPAVDWIEEEARRIFSEEFFDVDGPLSDEPLALARTLHARTFVTGEWVVDIDSAYAAAYIVWRLESHFDNREAAELRLQELKAHPDYVRLDDPGWIEAWLAVYEIVRGDVRAGVERLRSLPAIWGPGRDRYVSMAFAILLRKPNMVSDPLDPELIAYIREAIAYQGGMDAYLAASGDTRAELLKLLQTEAMLPRPRPG